MRALLTLLFCGMCCVWAQAGSIYFSARTPVGSRVAGLPVNATVLFAIGNGSMSIFVRNDQRNPTDIVQALSDLSFTLGGGGSLSGAFASSSSREITVNSNGSYTLGSTVPTGWFFMPSGKNFTTATLDVLDTPTFPEHLLIGGPPIGHGTRYSNANGSIAGNKVHNPFLDAYSTFRIMSAPGITSSTTITSVAFSFGITGINVQGQMHVPEPSAELLLGLGTLGLVGLATVSRKLISI